MLRDIKQTSIHSFIYALGNIGTKVIGLILIPIYTNPQYLSHDDFGVLAILEATMLLLTSLLPMAMHSSISRWYWDKSFADKQKSIFFSSLLFLAIIIIPTSLILLLNSKSLSLIIFSSTDYSTILQLTVATASLSVINNQISNIIRLQSKSLFFSLTQVVKLLLNLGLIIWSIVYNHGGINEIWKANLISEILVCIIYIPFTLKNISFTFESRIIKDMFSYGYPLMLSSTAAVILTVTDRYMLNSMVGLVDTGIYSLGYRIANTLQIVVAASIGNALIPIRMKKINDPNHHRFYSKNVTYVSLVFSFFLLLLSLFSLEILNIFTKSDVYLESNFIIPLIAFSLLFKQLKNYTTIGIIIKKKTKILGILTFITSLINIALNYLFISRWNFYGAAIATLLSQAFLYLAIVFVSHNIYPIRYEWRKLCILILTTLTYLCLGLLISNLPSTYRVLLKGLFMLSFPFTLYFLNFYERIEIDTVKKIIMNIKKKSSSKDELKNLFH